MNRRDFLRSAGIVSLGAAMPGGFPHGIPAASVIPQAESAEGRVDSLAPDQFKYEITARGE
jgi:hypothetical protein